ncbi:SAM-dependent methyltransferase [Paenibacillus sp. J5C_2022]|uniref:class I SAM-dependent methyltransferase n=1 Tax=Paenibacillus sp. J5C2022 TaxID=2977129 RepID=UPI0021D09F9F|nr:SAM-dependent methyltransferase [Paenibacillus sp. J5C2022]MCU6709493.1 SAM-dependent methyltransferase [Paenibacillus sp. J5C2022]
MANVQSESALEQKIERIIVRSRHQGAYSDELGAARCASCITFHDYMAMCLYDEEYGYYRQGEIRIGKEGDFYTSSAVGAGLAAVIASYVMDYAKEGPQPLTFVEWGAGTGRLSAQIAAEWKKRLPLWREKFRMKLVEDYPPHAEAARLHLPHANCLTSREALADAEGTLQAPAVILANELLDAFPVHRIQRMGGHLYELGVAVVNGHFRYVRMAMTNPDFRKWLHRDGIRLREGQITELCPGAGRWVREISGMMKRGRVIIIDYGYDAEEYSAAFRMDGTLMCYYRHMASDQPFQRPGQQDMTAHVSFSYLKAEARNAGFSVIFDGSQKQFMVNHGIMELLIEHRDSNPFSEEARSNRSLRQLLLSDGIGEAFRVLILEKD